MANSQKKSISKHGINKGLIFAVAKRDLRSYFMNPSGYVFLTLFIFLSAAAAFWSEDFFQNNLANLDQLNNYFPYLLLFFIPALTMSVWAEERKQGTDELLLTLPATDLEITLGKYLAVLGVYSASLALSLSHVLVLSWLGEPDFGLMFGNYFGYWMIGAALVAVGMLASALTSNVTVSFILGAIFCSLLVFVDSPQFAFSETFGKALAPLGLFRHFNDFTRGVISFSGLVYFTSIASLAIYLNIVVLGRRHWLREKTSTLSMQNHYAFRTVALVVIVISATAIAGYSALRIDVTSEGLHSLSDTTEELLAALPDGQPVLIQAFISPEVPQNMVETRENIIGFLREIDAQAGNNVQVIIRETEPYTQNAQDAREKFSILPRELILGGTARTNIENVFMGIAFTCGSREDVIPFFERGMPVEYELTRSIQSVAQTRRKKIGVVTTDAKLLGGFDFQTFKSSPSWPIVSELQKQYEVTQVAVTDSITETFDGLLVALPSSLTQPEMDNVMAYIRTGAPTLMLVDPMPTFDMGLAPLLPRNAGDNPFQQNKQAKRDPKGDSKLLLAEFGIEWSPGDVFWDAYNPHPELAQLPPELVFISQGNGAEAAFNAEEPVSSGLQELVLLYPGILTKSGTIDVNFTPLLSSGATSGTLGFQDLVQRSFFGLSLNRAPRRIGDPLFYVPAVRVSGDLPTKNSSDAQAKVNMIVIADLDFVGDQFFQIRNMGNKNLAFDNIPFFLNCMDVLVGDTSFIALRKKRVKHRTLTTVETQSRNYYQTRISEESKAEELAANELGAAQQRLRDKVAEVTSRTDLDAQTKQIMAQNLQEVENRRFEVIKSKIESKKEADVAHSKETMELQIRSIQSRIKTLAVVLPPLPALLFGIFIFIQRRKRERESMSVTRTLRRN